MNIEWNQLEIGEFSSDSAEASGCRSTPTVGPRVRFGRWFRKLVERAKRTALFTELSCAVRTEELSFSRDILILKSTNVLSEKAVILTKQHTTVEKKVGDAVILKDLADGSDPRTALVSNRRPARCFLGGARRCANSLDVGITVTYRVGVIAGLRQSSSVPDDHHQLRKMFRGSFIQMKGGMFLFTLHMSITKNNLKRQQNNQITCIV